MERTKKETYLKINLIDKFIVTSTAIAVQKRNKLIVHFIW